MGIGKRFPIAPFEETSSAKGYIWENSLLFYAKMFLLLWKTAWPLFRRYLLYQNIMLYKKRNRKVRGYGFLTNHEKKQRNSLMRRLQNVLVYAALLFCAVLASVTASLVVEHQYSNALRNDLFDKISAKANDVVSDVEDVFDSALSMNLYALDHNLYQEDGENENKLNSYTLYTCLLYTSRCV